MSADKGKAFSGEVVAGIALDTGLNCGAVVTAFQNFGDWGGALIPTLVGTELEEIAARVSSGDMSTPERMLLSQAMALQSIFTCMAKNASVNSGKNREGMLMLALKAQSQSRNTILALAELKNPRQATFVRQQNVSGGAQQVNNAASLPATPLTVTLEHPLELTNATASNLLVPVIPAKRVKALAPARPREEKKIAAQQTNSSKGLDHGRS